METVSEGRPHLGYLTGILTIKPRPLVALVWSLYDAGNLHKWAFAIRGCAVLWVNPSHHKQIYPPITSRYSNDNWQDNFEYQGTDDNSQYYAAADAIRYYQEIGDFVSTSTVELQCRKIMAVLSVVCS